MFSNTISIFNGVSPSPLKPVAITDVIERIRDQQQIKSTIEALRALTDKKEQNEIKKTLPAVTWSGTFDRHRRETALSTYSGLICLDYDHLEGDALESAIAAFTADPHVAIAFISPRGEGIKVIVAHDAPAEQHKEAFAQLSQYFAEITGLLADTSGSDVCRLCFLSHDPAIYTNPNAEVFNVLQPPSPNLQISKSPNPPPPAAPTQNSKPKTQNSNNTHEIVERLVTRLEQQKVSLASNYDEWLKIMSSLAYMGEEGRAFAHRVFGINAEKYVYKDTDDKFTQLLREPRKTTIASFVYLAKEALGIKKQPAAQTIAAPPPPPTPGSPDTDTDGDQPHPLPFVIPEFDRNGSLKGIKIENAILMHFCREVLNFRRLEIKGNTNYVILKEKLAHKAERKHLIDAVFKYIESLPDKIPFTVRTKDNEGDWITRTLDISKSSIVLKMMTGQATLLSEEKMLHLIDRYAEHRFIQHTAKCAYFYYANGVAQVTAEGINLIPYSQVDGLVWADNAHTRDYKHTDYADFTFAKFVRNIAAPKSTSPEEQEQRFSDFRTIIGYILHSFFDTKRKGIILTDSRIAEDANGRSGKSLLCTAISRIANASTEAQSAYIELDGKDFDAENRFKYEAVTPATSIMVINDLKRNFDPEALFNAITEGITVRRMHENPFRQLVKVVMTVNKTIKLEGGSALDRFLQVELTDHYSADFQPRDDFNEWFFTDWTPEQWQQFDTFMLDCVALYLKNGLKVPAPINLNDRYLLDRTSPDFVGWWEEKVTTGAIRPGDRQNKGELLVDFKEYMEEVPKFFTAQIFSKWLKSAAAYTKGFAPVLKEHESKSNGKSFITFPASGTAPVTTHPTQHSTPKAQNSTPPPPVTPSTDDEEEVPF